MSVSHPQRTGSYRPIADYWRTCFKAGMRADGLRNAIYERLDALKPGSLSFWGSWFGRPYDNVHRIVGADSLDGNAVIYFDHGESLIIEAPRDWSFDGGHLLVRGAERIRFQWFYYGRLPSRETLRYDEYHWNNGRPTFTSDFEQGRAPELDPAAPAVEVQSLR